MTKPAELLLVRHGESEGNLADAAAHAAGAERLELEWRDMDTPLSARGSEQAAALARWLAGSTAPPQVLVVSPYSRTRSTAEPIAAALGVRPRFDERLRERDLGAFDGLTRAGIERLYPDEARRRGTVGKVWYRPPGGESWADVAMRVRSLLRDLGQEYAGKRVVCVTHQAVIMVFRWVLEELDEAALLEVDRTQRLANAGVSRFELLDGELRLTAFNETAPEAEDTAEPPAEEAAESARA